MRAAINHLFDIGRPRWVETCVLVDRGGRQLPIQPDYAGRVLEVRPDHDVAVRVPGIEDRWGVDIVDVGSKVDVGSLGKRIRTLRSGDLGLGKDLIGLKPLTGAQIATILDTAEPFRQLIARGSKLSFLKGRTVVNLFFEPSTRTRTSFEFAEKRLSAETVNISSTTSAVQKGENLVDTARNLEAMRSHIVVVRHGSSGAAEFLANRIPSHVINAGDGEHEHPTQGLLDLLTIRDQFGDIAGRRVCIVGDIRHSRVARSLIWGLLKCGARVAVCGPPTLMPAGIADMGVERLSTVEEALALCDVLYVLRLQLERMQGGYVPSLREYNRVFGVTSERMKKARPDLIVLHPGPINRGVEIDSDVADGPRSVILPQVTNGVAVRMAVLCLLAGQAPGVEDFAGAPEELGLSVTA